MLKQLKSSKQGFTIIEVLIVLAIAGLIMLIVFLAVPALQRNSRNTSYRNEASQLLTAATEFTNNNSGTFPVASVCSAAGTSCTAASPTLDAQKVYQLTKSKNITDLTIVTTSNTAVTPSTSAATIDTGAACPTTVSGTSVTPVTGGTTPARSIIIIYAIESSSGLLAQCTAS